MKEQALAFRRRMSRLPVKARVDALLSEKDAQRAVRRLPPDLLYSTILEVGLADATELIQLTSPAQFQCLLDLGAWKKDSLDVHRLLTWLRAARGDDEQAFQAKLERMDLELLELLLREMVVIHDLEEQPDYEPRGVTMESPEGKYLLEFKVEGVELSAVRSLLNDLFAKDPFAAGRLLEAVRWELTTEMEEAAYRHRTARLADMGFPELYEALSLFSYIDPEKLAPLRAENQGRALAPPSRALDPIQAALEGLSDDERDRAEEELRYLMNQALVADGADPGDLEALRRVAERTSDYLSLGFEHLTSGQPSALVEALRAHPFKRIFQLGFSLTLKLKFRAERMLKAPLACLDGVPLLLEEEARVVAPLLHKRPAKAVKVAGAEPMTFRARRELWEAEQVLDRAQNQLAVFRALLGGMEEAARSALAHFGMPLSQLGVDRLFSAAVANLLLEGTPALRPVRADQLPALAKQVLLVKPSGTAVSSEAERRVKEQMAAAVSPADPSQMVERTLRAWVDEWGPAFAAQGVLDPRLLTTLPVEGSSPL